MVELIEKIRWLGHASFLIEAEKLIYIDPYQIPEGLPYADIIIITHDHFDHCSPVDAKKIQDFKTIVLGPQGCKKKFFGQYKGIQPGDTIEIKGIKIQAVHAYNLLKDYHQRSEHNLGVIITLKDGTVYHAGDTDFIPEMRDLNADIILLPVGGEYTMDAMDAAKAANTINPKYAVPMHYGSVTGNIYDARSFKEKCQCDVRILEPHKP